MKVTTDACTLGAWAPIESARTILDIGTGSGLLALFAAQRAPNATVDAIELDTESALQARSNFNLSPFNDRLTLIEGDITTFTTGKTYDAILCNPPFFSDSTLNDCSRLSQARQGTIHTYRSMHFSLAFEDYLTRTEKRMCCCPLMQHHHSIALSATGST
ncbi:tRNA (adenine37-N(6))-methyltransferase TrmN6 [Marinobacterium lacunae]|uniref:tRNA (Adenine37-N(6))-methyltransferase TrmN6 n=2 Tax=Marinobacterium lacunae TaxID=1232683 RepID=A0A081G4N1_9GAMM|nr:tRNA (adenine37-N(6))-methyltransferase TrmN6 [Marinobacterium lacunae]